MNSTIQQLQANQKFEKLLNLFEEIAPDNQNGQKQISLLSNSKGNYIKKTTEHVACNTDSKIH